MRCILRRVAFQRSDVSLCGPLAAGPQFWIRLWMWLRVGIPNEWFRSNAPELERDHGTGDTKYSRLDYSPCSVLRQQSYYQKTKTVTSVSLMSQHRSVRTKSLLWNENGYLNFTFESASSSENKVIIIKRIWVPKLYLWGLQHSTNYSIWPNSTMISE